MSGFKQYIRARALKRPVKGNITLTVGKDRQYAEQPMGYVAQNHGFAPVPGFRNRGVIRYEVRNQKMFCGGGIRRL